MEIAQLCADIKNLGATYMQSESNAAAFPKFKKDLTQKLEEVSLPREVIDRVLQPLNGLASSPHTSSTTFPYLALIAVRNLHDYADTMTSDAH